MADGQVYLEKMSAFSRMLRLEGINAGPLETADACRILSVLGMEDRAAVKTALSAIYAKSREAQFIFDRVFDGFFLSEEAMRAQARRKAMEDLQTEQAQRELQRQLSEDGQPNLLSEEQRRTFSQMPETQQQRLMQFLDKYKDSAKRSPELYGNFIHSVFAKSLLEQQMRMEDAAAHAAAADPELGILLKDISDFKDEEIPKAIAMIQLITQQINAELSARKKSNRRGTKLDFRRTFRKGLETGGTFRNLRYRKRPRRKRHLVLLCDVSGSMIRFSEFALRFIQSLNQASDSSRTFLFSEHIFEADPFSLQNMDLFRQFAGKSGLYGKGTNLATALESLLNRRPPVLTDSTTLIILTDTKTVEQQRALALLRQAKHLCGKVILLNPIAENQWQFLRSAQTMSEVCTMLSCNTLNALASACRRLATSP